MKAILYRHYGPPEALQLTEVEQPRPRDSQILVKIQAASVNTLDLAMRGPLIESRYPLPETAAALRSLEAGHTQGKIVITVDQNNPAYSGGSRRVIPDQFFPPQATQANQDR